MNSSVLFTKKRMIIIGVLASFSVILLLIVKLFYVGYKINVPAPTVEYYPEIKESLETGSGLTESEVDEILRRHDENAQRILDEMRNSK